MAFVEVAANTLDDAYSIENSVRFNDGDSPKLSRTPSSNGNRDIWTFSCWFKKTNVDQTGDSQLFSCGNDGSELTTIRLRGSGDDEQIKCENYVSSGSTSRWAITTPGSYRDPSAWYHLVLAVDTTQASISNGLKLWINGEAISYTGTTWVQNADTSMNSTSHENVIGARQNNNDQEFDGYMADVHFIDGTQKEASDFGETNDNGVWVPKKYSGSYGTNGFFLEFKNGRINELETATLDVTISGSASLGTDTPANLVDEDFSTVGIGVDNGGGVVQFDADFGSGVTKTIKSYGFRAAKSGAISQVVIKGSNDDSTYTTIDTDTSLATTSSGTRWNFQNVTNTTAYRYYRWEITTTTADHPDIVQFEAYTTQPTIFNEQDKAGGLGKDTSGNGNHFSSHNIYGYSDQTTDTPTNNFCTWNALRPEQSSTLLEGNTYVTGLTGGSGSEKYHQLGTIMVNKGKWYFELKVTGSDSDNNAISVGVSYWDNNTTHGTTTGPATAEVNATDIAVAGSAVQSSLAGFDQNDIVGIFLNCDDEEVTFYKNGSAYGSAADYSSLSAEKKLVSVYAAHGSSSTTNNVYLNAGCPAFSISSSNADANGLGIFEYSPVLGSTNYYALCTKNLAEYG